MIVDKLSWVMGELVHQVVEREREREREKREREREREKGNHTTSR